MSDLGTIALMIALAACLYGTVVPHLGVRTNNWNLIRSAQNAVTLKNMGMSTLELRQT